MVKYTSTSDMIADELTKPLQGGTFRKLRDKILNMESSQDAITGSVGESDARAEMDAANL